MSESSWTQARKLASLHPELAPLIERLFGRMYLRGFEPWLYFGARGLDTQKALLGSGNSQLTISFHNHRENNAPASLAADVVDRKLWWEAPEFFVALGEECHALGLVWGGDWHDPDSAHVQLWANSRLSDVTP